jgi:hypothetical protein
MICPACDFPILSRTELGNDELGQRILGEHCTHCGRVTKLVEIEIRPSKYSSMQDVEKPNRNT